VAAALMGLAAAPTALADLAVQHNTTDITETAGNNNGVWEPGDTLAVTENVMSFDFDQTFTGVSGTIATSFSGATINAATSAYPDLPVLTAVGNTTPFSVGLSGSMECGASVPLTLSLQTSVGSTDVPFDLPTGSRGAFSSYESSDVPRAIPDDDVLGLSSNLTVPGDGGRVKGLRVRIGHITHTYDGDLTITLVSPDGRSVKLVGGKGGSGDDFADTVFDDAATARITSTTAAPFTGTFAPVQPLSTFDGAPLAGNWTLKVVDSSSGDIGTLDAWGVDAAPAVCMPQTPPAPPPPHDCGQHNGGGGAIGLTKKPAKDKPCPNA
jgi:subtilisin-like proprotein convertase family protein